MISVHEGHPGDDGEKDQGEQPVIVGGNMEEIGQDGGPPGEIGDQQPVQNEHVRKDSHPLTGCTQVLLIQAGQVEIFFPACHRLLAQDNG